MYEHAERQRLDDVEEALHAWERLCGVEDEANELAVSQIKTKPRDNEPEQRGSIGRSSSSPRCTAPKKSPSKPRTVVPDDEYRSLADDILKTTLDNHHVHVTPDGMGDDDAVSYTEASVDVDFNEISRRKTYENIEMETVALTEIANKNREYYDKRLEMLRLELLHDKASRESAAELERREEIERMKRQVCSVLIVS